MFITMQRLQALAPHILLATAGAIAPLLEQEMPRWEVNTLLRRSHFMGEACWESGYFARFTENLSYTHAAVIAGAWPRLAARAAELLGNPEGLANAAYALHNGNGDEASGDGWRFRGRGMFQLTGRDNYAACGHAIGRDLLAAPDWVASPEGAVISSLWFWKVNGCNELADQDDVERVCRRINGPARAGLTQRIELTQQAKGIFA